MSPQLLVGVLRRHGFLVQRTDECTSPDDVAFVTNDVGPSDDDDRIGREQGHVLCNLGRRGADARVSRTHYATDEETYVQVFNVDCAIYPDEERERAQIARLVTALADLPRQCRVAPAGIATCPARAR